MLGMLGGTFLLVWGLRNVEECGFGKSITRYREERNDENKM
jgi:hypothetical protein